MRPVSSRWATTITRGHEVACEVHAFYDGTQGALLPLVSGQITYDSTAATQRRCTLTVPLYGPDGFRWDPGADPFHPLATNGQRVRVRLGVRHPEGDNELLDQGFYLVSSVSVDEDAGLVQVQGSDLMQLMTESKIFLAPDSVLPQGTDTHLTALQKLTWPALNSPSLQDVAILPTTSETLPVFTLGGTVAIRDGSDRVEIMKPILEAWGARQYVDDAGFLHFAPPLTGIKPVPDFTISGDLVDSTMTGQGRTQDRRRAYNAVKVIGRASDTGAVSGQAQAVVQTGALSARGPYGWVTRWYQSDLVASDTHAQTIAGTLLDRGLLFGRTERVACVPDPAIEIGDTGKIVTTAAGSFTGLCTSIVIPLTSAGGPMTMDITNIPDDTTTLVESP